MYNKPILFRSHHSYHLHKEGHQHWHLQLQSAVQTRPEREHLHLRLEHEFLQPHFVSSWQLFAIGGRVVQDTCHVSPFSTQPQSAGLPIAGNGTVAWLQMIPAWYAARFTCSLRASLVGGIASYGFCFRANSSILASLTLVVTLDRSYNITTNLSSFFRSSGSTTGGYWLSLVKVLDT